ncbi:hypothetical protein HMPREF1221_00156 [Treponema socranskii subsp. paredis ATCC 35535]|nr:hypothetical protein HMPREF1221_00156 [Treponema socranskii subsp. paredis ATCC 35535]
MKKAHSILLTTVFSFSLTACIFTKTLEFNTVQNFKIIEQPDDKLKISGLCSWSSYIVKNIKKHKENDTLSIIIEITPFHKRDASGSFDYVLRIPDDITSITFGKRRREIWNKASPFHTGKLKIGMEIPSDTVLIMNESQFTEQRFEFKTGGKGIIRYYAIEYCKKSDSFPEGIIYSEFREPENFIYISETGRIFTISDSNRILVYVPSGDEYFLYDDSKVYFRTPIYGRKVVSAWEMNNKTRFIFFNDGTCLDKNFSDEENKTLSAYTEDSGIIRLAFPLLPSPQYFLQDGNRLFSGFSYLYIKK